MTVQISFDLIVCLVNYLDNYAVDSSQVGLMCTYELPMASFLIFLFYFLFFPLHACLNKNNHVRSNTGLY